MIKKNLPNIILLVLFVGISCFLVYFYKSFGLGLFLKNKGIFVIIIGMLAFVFFLSIDPGYGWSKKINLTANYITISIAVVVLITGFLLLLLGGNIHENTVEKEIEKARCRNMLSENARDAVDSKWYFLTDKNDDENLALYLFQKKGEIKNFKLIAIESLKGNIGSIKEIQISSAYYKNPVVLQARDGDCTGVFEGNIITRKPEKPEGVSKNSFDVLVVYNEHSTNAKGGKKKYQLKYQLKNKYHF